MELPQPSQQPGNTSFEECRLAVQLARTEEAAKRALVWQDPNASGSLAKRVLELERQVTSESSARIAAEGDELPSTFFTSKTCHI